MQDHGYLETTVVLSIDGIEHACSWIIGRQNRVKMGEMKGTFAEMLQRHKR